MCSLACFIGWLGGVKYCCQILDTDKNYGALTVLWYLSVAPIILTEKGRYSYKGAEIFCSYSLLCFLFCDSFFFWPCSLFPSFSSSPASQVMQFGRIDGNAYILDFQYPFSAVQAFAVALANVTQRLKWKSRDWREENVNLLIKSKPENVRAACFRCAEMPGS